MKFRLIKTSLNVVISQAKRSNLQADTYVQYLICMLKPARLDKKNPINNTAVMMPLHALHT